MIVRGFATERKASMGLDDLISGALGGGSSDAARKAAGLLDQFGGLAGLVGKLQAGGLGDQVGSWIGKGGNAPVSSDQLRAALGDDGLRGAGLDPKDLGGLAEMLPKVIDGLTPDGAIPGADQLQGMLGKLLG